MRKLPFLRPTTSNLPRFSAHQVPRFERNPGRRPADTHGKRPMLARFQGGRVGFEIQPDKRDGKQGRLPFRAGNLHRRGAGLQVLRRKHDQRSRRGGEHNRTLHRDGHLIGVCVAAETLAKNFEAVRQRSHSWGGRDFDRSRRSLAWRENGRGHSPRAALNRAKNDAGIQWRHEKSPARCIGLEPVSV